MPEGCLGTFDIGSRVVSPAFWALGVRRLDYMSITHGDEDHIGGAASVFGISVLSRSGKAYLFRRTNQRSNYERWPSATARYGERSSRTTKSASARSICSSDILRFPDWERQRVRNDDSEVIEIRYGGVSFVFTGDIGREVEHQIALFVRAGLRFGS